MESCLLLCSGGDLVDLAGHLVDMRQYLFQCLPRPGRLGCSPLHLVDPFHHCRYRQLRLSLYDLDHFADFPGRLGGSLSQCPDFVSHHGKAAPLFAGPGCFDGCVQSQQIGLVGNVLNTFPVVLVALSGL